MEALSAVDLRGFSICFWFVRTFCKIVDSTRQTFVSFSLFVRIIISFLDIISITSSRKRPLFRDDGELSLRFHHFTPQFVHRNFGIKVWLNLLDFFWRWLLRKYGFVWLTLSRIIGGGVVLEGDLELLFLLLLLLLLLFYESQLNRDIPISLNILE